MATLYIVRHGHIETHGRFIGRTDIPLSPLGHEQAIMLGRLLASVPFDVCLSSPLKRCLETARHILDENLYDAREYAPCEPYKVSPLRDVPESCPPCQQSPPMRIIRELQEISLGVWEGKSKEDIKDEFPDIWEKRGAEPWEIAPPQGESYAMVHERLQPVVQTLSAFDSLEKGNILIVAHRTVGQMLMGHYSRLPFSQWPLLQVPYGSVTLCPLTRFA